MHQSCVVAARVFPPPPQKTVPATLETPSKGKKVGGPKDPPPHLLRACLSVTAPTNAHLDDFHFLSVYFFPVFLVRSCCHRTGASIELPSSLPPNLNNIYIPCGANKLSPFT